MNDPNSFEEAVDIVRSSPLLTLGQRSLYISRLRTVSSVEQKQVITFLEKQQAELERKLRQIPAKAAFRRISEFVNQKYKAR